MKKLVRPLVGQPLSLQSTVQNVMGGEGENIRNQYQLRAKQKKISQLVKRQIKTEPCLLSWHCLREKRERSSKPQMINKDGDS